MFVAKGSANSLPVVRCNALCGVNTKLTLRRTYAQIVPMAEA